MLTDNRKIYRIGAAILAFAMFAACQKELSNNSHEGIQKVQVYLSDDPVLFDNVFIEILAVRLQVDTCQRTGDDIGGDDNSSSSGQDDDSCKTWTSLQLKPGVYDVLALRNGLDTLLATGNVPAGRIRRLQLTLGANNAVVVNGLRIPLASINTGNLLTVKLKSDDIVIKSGSGAKISLDFDLARSIIQTGNNRFELRPFITAFNDDKGSRLRGEIAPKESRPLLKLYNASDTAFGLPDSNGRYKLRGLKAGTYNLFIDASNGYMDTTITGIQILSSAEKRLNRITLHK